MAVNKSNKRRAQDDFDSLNQQSAQRRNEEEPASKRHDRFDPANYVSNEQRESYASAHSREAALGGYREKRKKRSRKKVVLISLIATLVVVLGGIGIAFGYVNNISSNLFSGLDPQLDKVLVKTDLAKEPFYMVLMGTDGSAERAESDEYGGDNFRSDSIMLLRIDPTEKKVTMVSLHRDLSVDLGEYGQGKLNAAHAYGGAALAVEKVSEIAGVPISHYAEINFDGFKGIVDALGGVEVDVPIEIDDADAGGYLAPGLQTLNGDQALILCRSRHSYDDKGDGDSYRAANQRLVLAAIAKKLLSSDIPTMTSTIDSLSQYVTTDLSIYDIVGLAQAMHGLDPSTDIYTAMTPTTSKLVGDIWYEQLKVSEWNTMMDRMKKGLSPTEEDLVDEETGTVLANTGKGSISSNQGLGLVVVKNGSGLTGVASEAGARLKKAGYTVEIGNADSFEYPQTIVIYNQAEKAEDANALVETLSTGSALQNDGTYSFSGDFLVIIGQDWQ